MESGLSDEKASNSMDPTDTAREAAVARLVDAGLRPTKARLAVLMTMEDESDASNEVMALVDSLKERGTPVALSTAYQIVRDFEDAGVLCRRWTRDVFGAKRRLKLWSQDPAEQSGAIELNCKRCGCTLQVKDEGLFDLLSEVATSRGFDLQAPAARATGLCQACVATGAQSRSGSPSSARIRARRLLG